MPWEMNNQEKIDAAGRKKEEGNLLFKNGKYERAGKKYNKVAQCAGLVKLKFLGFKFIDF